jgi:parallel beta-helix repeat protein
MKKLILALICLLFAIPSQAAIITVDDDGPADFNNIQAAINAAVTGDTVLVADGTYTGLGNRDIDFLGKAITVRSQSGPENCIIDCNGTETEPHRGFCFNSGEDTNSVLDGFTIINGTVRFGGVIYCGNMASPTITNCTISDNSAGVEGAAIYCDFDSNPTISNCTISNNKTSGIFCYHSNLIINNCTITGNSTEQSCGGGVNCWAGNVLITNSIISGNHAAYFGGGIACFISSPTITNCIIEGNSAEYDGGGIYGGEGVSPTITNCTISSNTANHSSGGIFCRDANITNCILWNNLPRRINYNASVTYSDVQGGWPGQGNIDTDPCFVLSGYWVDINDPNIIVEPNDPNAIWLEGDYHLLPASPCIDTGDPNYIPEPNETDLDGNPRISGTRIDMGAYEANYIEAEMNFTPKIINCNSKGNWVKAHFTLPDGFLPEDVDINEPAWAEPMHIQSEYIKVLGSNPVKLEIAFDREAFCARITETGQLEVTIIDSLITGQRFYASDSIKIISQR